MNLEEPRRSETTLAALFAGPGRPFELRELPLPAPTAGEALVRVTYCTLCGSDLHTITGARQEPVPTILGHEALGVVAAVGEEPLRDVMGEPLRVGDRVTWSVCVGCGTCDRCVGGIPQKCRNLAKYGHSVATGRGALSGGLAETILLRAGTAAIKIDQAIPDEVLCPVNCATATVAAAYRLAGPLSGKRVLIFGAGMLGLTAAAFATSEEAAQVIVTDLNAERLEQALRFGADGTVVSDADRESFAGRLREAAGTDAFDVVLELSGSPDAVEAAIACGDINAQVVLVGSVMPSREVAVDPETIVRRWLSIRGVHNYTPTDLQSAVEFLRRFHTDFPFAGLVERTFKLADINEAVEFATRERPVRIAVRP